MEKQMREIIYSYVHKVRGVTFVEIEKQLAKAGLDYKGDRVFCSAFDENIVFWMGANDDFINALVELVNSGDIYAVEVHPLIYLIDGKMLTLPIAKRPPKAGYKEPHWMPVVLNPGPRPAKKGKGQ